ncbi:MAG TPA: cytochrome-c oxidase, cbb3-type subunit III [Phenylobacterium sp.]|jgi:cytochrome c oxidase cbb3-type subunit 3|nr:cytochrome-c oxidase, cbb3-type subunit III [Phenylobacterium sp.]
MSERKIDEPTGVETTGHEWDGIRELDNPLPRWWLWTWYACIAVAVVYWVLMPAWPGLHGYTKGILHQSDRVKVVHDLAKLKALRGAEGAQLQTASLEEIERDPKLQAYAMAAGQALFGDNCATCHGQGGTGGKGYPNLRDDVWLWGGSLEQIQHTITYGVRTGEPGAGNTLMPAFGRDQMLKDGQIDDLTEYVVALSHRRANPAAVARVAQLFTDQCASCHGPLGKGDQSRGIPNLTDNEWLYGSTREAIRDQIVNGRGGVMPTWGKRFDPQTIKALTVYIHANAGGQ